MTPTSASSSGGGAKFTDDGLSAADRKQRRLSSIAESQRRSSAGGAAGSARRSTSVAIGGGGGLLDVEPLLKQLSGVESSLRRAASVKQRAFQDPRDALLVGTQLAPGMRPRVVNQIDLEQDESDLLDFAYQILAQMEVSAESSLRWRPPSLRQSAPWARGAMRRNLRGMRSATPSSGMHATRYCTCIETDSPQHVRVNILHCCYIAWRTYATTSTI